jgi:hypothetical protein
LTAVLGVLYHTHIRIIDSSNTLISSIESEAGCWIS